jgi:hypothetical protein
MGLFPEDIVKALQKSIANPSATANGETDLLLVLRQYDAVQKPGFCAVVDLQDGVHFQTENGKVFRKGAVRRKRIACTEIKTGLQYSFSPITLVKPLIEPEAK